MSAKKSVKKSVKQSKKKINKVPKSSSKLRSRVSRTVKRAKLMPQTSSYEVTIKSKTLGEAPSEYHFILHDGKKLKNLFELVDELESMHDHVFDHHVNEFKNDFSNWVRDVFEAPDLAHDLKQVEDKLEMQRALIRRLVKEVMELKK